MQDSFILPDKFGIINNQTNIYSDQLNIEDIFHKYIVDDLDKKNASIISSSHIHQIIWFNKINISCEKINSIINNNLLEIRNKFRNNIKKNILTIDSINTFIVKFINRIKYINHLLNNNKYNLILNSYEYLGSYIITDSIILQFMEELIIKFKNYIIIDIQKFLVIVKDINNFYYDKIINIIKNILTNNFKINFNLKLPNLTNIYHLTEKIKYYYKVTKYYNFIDFNDFIKVIIYNISSTIMNANIKDIYFIFTNLFPKLIIIIKNKSIMINIMDILLHKLNKNTFNVIFKIITNNIDYIKIDYLALIINNLYIEEYVDFIDESIKNNFEETSFLENAIIFIKFINNDEKLFNYYNKKLLNRLIFMFDNNLDNYDIEFKIIKKFNNKYYYNKLHKLITDVRKSYNNYNNNNYKILIVSHIWNLNYSTLDLKKFNGILNKYLNDYENKYLIDTNDKMIKWLPHYGKIMINYLNIDILMLPIQFMILELFEDVSRIKFDDIFSIFINSNYDNKFQYNIIDSLIDSNIIFNENSYLILNDTPTFKNNLIDIFFSISNYNYELDSCQDLLQFSQEEVIEANINSILKLEDLDYNALFKKIREKINLFTISERLFNKTLDIMIKKDLIQIIDSKYIKIYY